MRKLGIVLLIAVAAGLVGTPAFAQAEEESPAAAQVEWGMLAAALSIGLAGTGAALAMGRSISSACSGMARNPGATGAIRLTLIIGLAFIESVAIYALLIAFFGVGLF